MSPNSFGQNFQWTSFGESHGPAMGVVIDGCPAGVEFRSELLFDRLQRRRPGQKGTTARSESDQPEVLSGVFEGVTLGTPIAILVKNQNTKSKDYDAVRSQPRVGHADDTWAKKFGHWDHRGGGRASARETVNWVMAGAVAEMFCQTQVKELQVRASLQSVGGEAFATSDDPALLEKLEQARQGGESFGAIVELKIQSPPPSLGEPVFRKAKSEMAKAFMLINACSGVELGDGFGMAQKEGTKVHQKADSPVYGGIRGGITTGEDISFRLAFKPTSSILDVAKQGRHDPCVAIRALPVVEAMAWSVLADLILAQRLNRSS